MHYQSIIDKYYPVGTRLRDIYLKHCRAVAHEALYIARDCNLPLDPGDIEAAAMLHDIGIYATHAPSIGCLGSEPYIRHGIIGAALLRREGVDERYALVAERHTGSGLSADDIVQSRLPLPKQDFLPISLLEKLICYADKFYSKSGDMKRKPIDVVQKSIAAFGESSAVRFSGLRKLFGHCPVD